MRYRPNASYMYTENEMRSQIFRLVPQLAMMHLRFGRLLDVLITHSPVWHIHDQPDLPHTGFKVFLTLLKLVKPKLMLHGHVHLYQKKHQRSQFEETTIINVYPAFVFEANRSEKENSFEFIISG
jgi:Icc-related predicted phosphoesterase